MVDTNNHWLSITRQCGLLSISRSSFYYETKGENPLNLTLMRLIDEQFLEEPSWGCRQMARYLRREGYCVGQFLYCFFVMLRNRCSRCFGMTVRDGPGYAILIM